MYYYLKNISIKRKCTVYLPNVKCFDVIHNIQKTFLFDKIHYVFFSSDHTSHVEHDTIESDYLGLDNEGLTF